MEINQDKLTPKPRFIKEGGKLYIKETFFMSCLLTAITIFFWYLEKGI